MWERIKAALESWRGTRSSDVSAGARLELRAFVAQSLEDIVGAIRDVHSHPDGHLINPENRGPNGEPERLATLVKFDLLVGITRSSGAEGRAAGKADITVVNADLRLTGRRSRDEKRESRLQFEVPVLLPVEGDARFSADGIAIVSRPLSGAPVSINRPVVTRRDDHGGA